MATATSHYATTADAADEMDTRYTGGEQTADYYPTPESVVHIGAHATHVTVHVHAYAPPPPPVSSSSVDVDVRHEHLYPYSPNPRPTSPPPQPTPNDAAPPSAAPTPPRTTTATRSVADTLGDTLAALPDGLLSPTVRAVVQQVLRRASEPSSPRTADDHPPANTVVTDVPATETRLGQRGQNVAISLMMQPLSTDGTTTSLTDLFRQLNNGSDTPAAQGVPLGNLNRHTEVIVHESGRGLHDTCAVCQEPLEPGQVVRRVLRCGHTFHHTCLDQWLEANATCPMCMQPVVPSAVEGRSGADEGVSRTDGFSPPSPPPPPPLHPPPPRASSSSTSITDRQSFAYSPRTTAVVQQVDALLTSEEEEENDDDDQPSRVHVQSVEVRRIPIRMWRTTAASDTETVTTDTVPASSTTTAPRSQRQTVVDRILASALDELTLDTIEEDRESGESDDDIAMV